MFRWIVVFAWVAGILGVAGSVVIFYKIRHHNSVESELNTKEKPEKIDTLNSLQEPLSPKHLSQNKETPSIKDTPDRSTVVNPEEAAKNKKEDTNPEAKLMSQQGLQHLLSNIKQASEKYNLASKCIRFRRSAVVNNLALYRQVEAFLTGYHYSLQTVEATDQIVKGITLFPDGGCLRVTVGKF